MLENIIKIIVCVLALTRAVTINAQPVAQSQPVVYTLKDCILRGLETNLSLQVTRNAEQAAHNNATLANAGALPSVELTAGYKPTYTNNDNITSRSTGQETKSSGIFDFSTSASAALNWTIFDGFKIQANYKQLRLLEQRGETDTRLAIEDLIADIASEYYNYIQQIIRRSHYRYSLRLSRERLRIAELNYQTGSFSGLDYHMAKVDFNSDSAQYVKQQQTVHASLIRLNKLLSNSNVTQRIMVPDSSIIVREDLELAELWDKTQQVNASILRASQNTLIAEASYKKIVSRNYPYLKLNAQYSMGYNHYEASATHKRSNDVFAGGLTMGITVFDGNRRRERRNAALDIENSKLQREELEISLLAQLTTLWEAYHNYLQLLGLQKQNLEIAENNLEIALERYKLGNLSGFDMRQVQKSLLDAEERVLQVEYDAKLCEISLLQMSGEIGNYLE